MDLPNHAVPSSFGRGAGRTFLGDDAGFGYKSQLALGALGEKASSSRSDAWLRAFGWR